LDEITIGPKRDLRWPSLGWLAAAAAAGLIAAAVTLIVTSGGGRHAPRPPGAPGVAAAPSPPAAAPGTVLLTCDAASWGQLPSDWRAHSLRAGPLWFVSYDRPPGYVHLGGPHGPWRTAGRRDELGGGVMIVEVTEGLTAVMKPAAAARPYFRFLDGFHPGGGDPLPHGDTGFTFSSCPRGQQGPNGQVTDFYLGFTIQAGRTAPVDVRTAASSRPIRLMFMSPDSHGTG